MALSFVNCSDVLISNSSFQWIREDALDIRSSNITIMNSSFEHANGSLRAVVNSYAYITGSVFLNNTGGAVHANNSMIYLTGTSENIFFLNTVGSSGGAIECNSCTLTITGGNSFRNNTARDRYSHGGVISVNDGDLVITLIWVYSFLPTSHSYSIFSTD